MDSSDYSNNLSEMSSKGQSGIGRSLQKGQSGSGGQVMSRPEDVGAPVDRGQNGKLALTYSSPLQ